MDRYSPRKPPKSTLSPRKSPIHQRIIVPKTTCQPPTTRLEDIQSLKQGLNNYNLQSNTLRKATKRWIKATRSHEYRGIETEEQEAKLHAIKTQIELERAQSILPSIRDDARKKLSKLLTAKHYVEEAHSTVELCRKKWKEIEAKCVLEASHLMLPIHNTLETIASIDNPNSNTASIFTVAEIEQMIPPLPPKKAYLKFDPEAQLAAKHAEEQRRHQLQEKLRKDQANGVSIVREPRSISEIVLTALSIVAKPEAYLKVAENHCHGKKMNNDTHSACTLLQEQPYLLVDDLHYEDMPVFLHGLAADILTGSLLAGNTHNLHVSRRRRRRQSLDMKNVTTPKKATSPKSNDHTSTSASTKGVKKYLNNHVSFQLKHDRDAAKQLRQTLVGLHGSGSGTFFDPLPQPFQIRELSHCLGIDIVEEKRNKNSIQATEIFSEEYLMNRKAAISSLFGNDKHLKDHMKSPMFVLLRLSLGILHLWQSLMNTPIPASIETNNNTKLGTLKKAKSVDLSVL
jgi:hypothetical protein